MTRGMKKRETENLTPALADRDRRAGLPGSARGGAPAPGFTLDQATTTMLPPRVPDASLHQLDQLMEREPERVAAQVKAWMAED